MARSALTGAGDNIRINLKGLKDHQAADSMQAELRVLENRSEEIEAKIQATLTSRGGISAS